MAYVDLSYSNKQEIITDMDNIVIKQVLGSITGGVVVDTTGYEEDLIYAGHPVIKGASGYALMPVVEGALDDLPENYSYVGFVIATTPTAFPSVGVVNRGKVDPSAFHFTATAEQIAAMKTALPTIIFETD